MKLKASEILSDFEATSVLGNFSGPDITITGIAPIEQCGKGDLVFLEKAELIEQVIDAQPSAVVTTSELIDKLCELKNSAVFTSNNVRLAQALIRQKYVDRDLFETGWPKVHPSAVIH